MAAHDAQLVEAVQEPERQPPPPSPESRAQLGAPGPRREQVEVELAHDADAGHGPEGEGDPPVGEHGLRGEHVDAAAAVQREQSAEERHRAQRPRPGHGNTGQRAVLDRRGGRAPREDEQREPAAGTALGEERGVQRLADTRVGRRRAEEHRVVVADLHDVQGAYGPSLPPCHRASTSLQQRGIATDDHVHLVAVADEL